MLSRLSSNNCHTSTNGSPPRPTALAVIPEAIPSELTERHQWVAWRHVARDGKYTKLPLDVNTGRNAKSDDPETWASFEEALSYYSRAHVNGIGYVFARDDPYTGIDLDDCRDPVTGEIKAWAKEVLEDCQPTYAEVSPSRRGVKLWVKASLPWSNSGAREKVWEDAEAGRVKDGEIEVYHHSRFFAVTGNRLEGAISAVEPRQEAVDCLVQKYFRSRGQRQGAPPPPPLQGGYAGDQLSDAEIIALAMRAASGAKFARLWQGGAGDYRHADGRIDDSRADLALCDMLAFYTGPRPERIERLFSQSARGSRQKWRDRPDYRQRTIAKAIEGRNTYYHPRLAPRDGSARPAKTAAVVSLSAVRPLPVAWLWEQRIPRGAITLLDGDPGLGKSTISLDLAARVSCGWKMPPDGGASGIEPANVLILTAEDDLARTIRPRLDAAEADVNRVFAFEAINIGDDQRPPVLPADIDVAEAIICERAVKLLIVDPLMAYLDDKVDAHKDQNVRRVLHRLAILAQKTDVAILCIRHLNKLNAGPALYRGGGSIGIIGAARAALLVGRHPEESGRCVLASIKNNLGPMPKSRTYSYEPKDGVARIGWGGETELTANDILTHPSNHGADAVVKAEEFVADLLADGMPKNQSDIVEKAKAAGITEKTLKRAKRNLYVRSFKESFHGNWLWELSRRG